MSKRKYSTIWLHFVDDGEQRAKCKHCHKTLSTADGCHSNLKRHLKAKHSIKPLSLEAQVPTEESVVKYEEHFEDQSVGSTEITAQQQELAEFVSSTPPDKKNSSNTVTKRKYSVIWLYFEDEGGQRAKCKYCKATLSFSGGSHGNLRRHMKLKHPLTHLNFEEHVTIPQEILNFGEPNDEDPLTSGEIRMEKQDNEEKCIDKLEPIVNVDKNAMNSKNNPKSSVKRKKSAIWSYFEDIGCHRARCKHCRTTISFSGGCHGNLRRHFKLKHSQIYMNMDRKPFKPRVVPNFEETARHQPVDTTPTEIPTELIDKQVLKMIAKGNHSLRLVEEPEFQQLIQYVSNCPGYTLPSKKTFSHSLIPSIQMELLDDIKGRVQSTTAVCLTIDGWTSSTNINCLTVTVHYINTDTMLTSHLLAYEEFENRYSSETISNFLRNVVSYFELSNKVKAIVSNNDPDIVAAIHQEQFPGVSCFAHSLNFTVQAAIVEIADTINKVRKIVQYFLKNVDALQELQMAQKQINLAEIKLKCDTPNRWNSTFEMLRRFNQIKEAIVSILSINRPDLMLVSEDWQIIGETIAILRPFYEITVEISGETNFTLSKVTILYNLLDRHIAKCLPSNEEVTAMVINLQMGTASCFGNLEKNSLYGESTILDPRFKRKGFRNESSYEQALTNLRSKICDIELPSIEDETAGAVEEESIWEAYDSEFNESVAPDNNTAASIREFDKYMNEEYLDRRKDPLLWWKERQHLYPRLYLCALKRLCIVASSVPCQQIFSSAGQNTSQRRCLLNPNKIEGLLFLNNM